MNTPDKIYIDIETANRFANNHEGGDYKKEYICKDTILSMIKDIDECYVLCGYGQKGFYKLVDKIKSM